MAIYAIGDIQGCFNHLKRLLDKIGFDCTNDRLWLTGDLVNRGPSSLETLRFIKGLGESAVVILGNHDLHLLACYYGKRSPHKKDTLNAVLNAHDSEDLLNWLRNRPLLHHENNFCLVHAGLPPQWDIHLARRCAKKVEAILRDSTMVDQFFDHMYGDTPDSWDENLEEWAAVRFIVNAFTRMRYCKLDGSIDTKYKGIPGTQPKDLVPWFDHPHRKSNNQDIIFGHWSTLGTLCRKGIYNLDTGCVWGGKLTALKLETKRVDYFQVDCDCHERPDLP